MEYDEEGSLGQAEEEDNAGTLGIKDLLALEADEDELEDLIKQEGAVEVLNEEESEKNESDKE